MKLVPVSFFLLLMDGVRTILSGKIADLRPFTGCIGL